MSNDRFFAKNKAGYWEMYTADKNARQVGKEYVQAGAFIEDVTLSLRRVKLLTLLIRMAK